MELKQTWEFAHPDNKKNTGPLDRFKTMIKGKSYNILLGSFRSRNYSRKTYWIQRLYLRLEF